MHLKRKYFYSKWLSISPRKNQPHQILLTRRVNLQSLSYPLESQPRVRDFCPFTLNFLFLFFFFFTFGVCEECHLYSVLPIREPLRLASKSVN